MNTITFQKLLPNVFASRASEFTGSDVWLSELTLSKGEKYLLRADSGTGKSSLCSFIYGYRSDYQGKILFDHQAGNSLRKSEWTVLRKSNISLLFQDLKLFEELTAYENIQLKNKLTGYKTKAEIKQWFEILGIADKVDSPTGKLSFGQQQRVALIRTFCQPFDFLLMDEPISHLDDDNARIVARLTEEEAGKQGAGILVTSIGKDLPLNFDKTLKL